MLASHTQPQRMVCSAMPRLGRRSDRNMTPPIDEAASKPTAVPPDSPGTPPLAAPASVGGNTIEDDAFFEHLPSLLQDVSDKLTKLLDLEADAVQAAAALGPMASLQPPPPRDSMMLPDAEQPENVRTLLCTKAGWVCPCVCGAIHATYSLFDPTSRMSFWERHRWRMRAICALWSLHSRRMSVSCRGNVFSTGALLEMPSLPAALAMFACHQWGSIWL